MRFSSRTADLNLEIEQDGFCVSNARDSRYSITIKIMQKFMEKSGKKDTFWREIVRKIAENALCETNKDLQI